MQWMQVISIVASTFIRACKRNIHSSYDNSCRTGKDHQHTNFMKIISENFFHVHYTVL